MTKLSKEQYIHLSNIFHKQHDERSETETGDIPTASFTAVVGMVEDYIGVTRTPVLDGSEMIGEETADEYLDRLVKKASPAWQVVDPEQFLNEIRGRMPEIEWKPGPPTTPGRWIVAVHGDHPFLGTKGVFHSHWASNHTGTVYCPSFPEVEEVKFHAAWPQYPDHV